MDIADFVARRANDAFRDEREQVPIIPIDSVRPGWHRAFCTAHSWDTNGSEPALEDARDEHLVRDHSVGKLTQGVYAIVTEYRRLVVDRDRADAQRRERIDALEDALRRVASPFSEDEDYDPTWRIDA